MYTRRQSIIVTWLLALLFGLFTLPTMAGDDLPQQPPTGRIAELQELQEVMVQEREKVVAATTDSDPGPLCDAQNIYRSISWSFRYSDDLKMDKGWAPDPSQMSAHLSSTPAGLPIGCWATIPFGVPLHYLYGTDYFGKGIEKGEIPVESLLYQDGLVAKLFANPVFPFANDWKVRRLVLRETLTNTAQIPSVVWIDTNNNGVQEPMEGITGTEDSLVTVSLPGSPLGYGFDFLWEEGAEDFMLELPYDLSSIQIWWQDFNDKSWWTGLVTFEVSELSGQVPISIELEKWEQSPDPILLYLPDITR